MRFIFVVWNLVRAKRTGWIHLGLLEIDKRWDKKKQLYSGDVLINVVWAAIPLVLLVWRVLQLMTSR